jgi:hypothetical protein
VAARLGLAAPDVSIEIDEANAASVTVPADRLEEMQAALAGMPLTLCLTATPGI